MDQEEASYIIRHFAHQMTEEESMAFRHQSSLYKLEPSTNETVEQNARRRKMYLEKGWLSSNPEVLHLLSDGYAVFEKRTAQRIKKEGKVFLNVCPQCQKLARTPQAKQCRYCWHDWH